MIHRSLGKGRMAGWYNVACSWFASGWHFFLNAQEQRVSGAGYLWEGCWGGTLGFSVMYKIPRSNISRRGKVEYCFIIELR